MNPFEMVVAIIAIGAIASVARARLGVLRTRHGEQFVGRQQPDPETERLQEELRRLKERVAVLERLVTDQPSALDREFEKLRQMD